MDAWLVIARFMYDDAPLSLFAEEKMARDYAASVTPEDARILATDVLDLHVGLPVSIGVILFIDGDPMRVVTVQRFNE